MQERLRGNEFRTTVVCVDSYDRGVLAGRFFNPCCPGGQPLDSFCQFLLQMGEGFVGIQLPQSFTAVRAFSDPPASKGTRAPAQTPGREGALCTFAVRILFRQNASWQGSVIWLEEKREESFRSALELVLLMDSALKTAQN